MAPPPSPALPAALPSTSPAAAEPKAPAQRPSGLDARLNDIKASVFNDLISTVDLAELAKLPGYATLRAACEERGVELMEAPMSITGMVNVGEGAVTLGFAAEEHVAEF